MSALDDAVVELNLSNAAAGYKAAQELAWLREIEAAARAWRATWGGPYGPALDALERLKAALIDVAAGEAP